MKSKKQNKKNIEILQQNQQLKVTLDLYNIIVLRTKVKHFLRWETKMNVEWDLHIDNVYLDIKFVLTK